METGINRVGMDQLINELRSTAKIAAGKSPNDGVNQTQEVNFATILKNTIEEVNTEHVDAKALARSYEVGNKDVNLQEVMVSLQKANLTFQTMVQVRNKLVTAYQEVMNMQV